MDHQNYYYGKHNPIGTVNYQAIFANSSSDYQTSGFNDPTHLHHTTGIGFNSGTNGTNNASSDVSNNIATNLSRSASNNLTTNQTANEFSAVAYNRLYPYIPDNAVHNAATSNSSHTRGYHSNLNYRSYQNVDYSMQKALNQNYSTGAIMSSSSSSSASSSSPTTSSTQHRSTLNSSAGFSSLPLDHVVQPTVKSRTGNTGEAKLSATTSVIKPLNAYNTGTPDSGSTTINYAKYVQSYPMYANNNKTVPTEKSPATNRGLYLNSSATHKSSEVYRPEPIPARPGYPITVSTPGTIHTNPTYLSAKVVLYAQSRVFTLFNFSKFLYFLLLS